MGHEVGRDRSIRNVRDMLMAMPSRRHNREIDAFALDQRAECFAHIFPAERDRANAKATARKPFSKGNGPISAADRATTLATRGTTLARSGYN